MIYAFKIFVAILILVQISALHRFPLQKKNDREFVAQILSRAAKGIK